MKGERTLEGILLTIGVGAAMINNVEVCTRIFYRNGKELASMAQEYFGPMTSNVVEYGLPALAFLGTTCIGILAVKATDRYLLNRTGKETI